MHVDGVDGVGTRFQMFPQQSSEAVNLPEFRTLRLIQPMTHEAGVLDRHCRSFTARASRS